MNTVKESEAAPPVAALLRWLLGWIAAALIYLWALTVGQTVNGAVLGTLPLTEIPAILGPALIKVTILLPFGLLAVGPAVAAGFAAVRLAGIRDAHGFAVGGLVAGVAHAAGPIALGGGIAPDDAGRIVAYVATGPLAGLVLHRIVRPALPGRG